MFKEEIIHQLELHPSRLDKEKIIFEAMDQGLDDFFEGKVTLPLIIVFQKGNKEERKFLSEILKKEKRNEDDFSETLSMIYKYKAVEASLKRAEYFVNVSHDSLGIFPDNEEKKILQNLTSFSLNRSF